MALEILPKLIEFEPKVDSGLPEYKALSDHIDTAKFCIQQFRRIFQEGSEEYRYLHLHSFLQYAKKHKDYPKLKTDEQYMETSLWHGYFDDYPVYTCLFFPHILTDKNLPTTLKLSLETYFFIKVQAFKLLAKHQKTLHISRIRLLARSLRKFISINRFDHLNTPEYKQVTKECELYHFCEDLNVTENPNESEQPLKDSSSFKQIKDDDEVRWIKESKINIKNFFMSFCGTPKRWREPDTRGADKSERAKYNQKMGLVLSTKNKQSHFSENMKIDGSSTKIKTMRRKAFNSKSRFADIFKEESNDDLDIETQTDSFVWVETKPCELNNPIASLIHGQQLLPHIALTNQLLKTRAINKDIQGILRRIQETAEELNQNTSEANTFHIIDSLKCLLALLTGRQVEQIETDAFLLNEKNLFINEDVTILKVGFPQYNHRGYLGHKKLYIDTESEELELAIPDEIRTILRPLFIYLKSLRGENSSISLKLTSKQRSYSNFDFREIKSHVQRSYFFISSDSWLTSIFTWQTGGVSNTQKHYASYPLRKAQVIFENHIQSFLGIDFDQTVRSNRTNNRIGSPYYLKAKVYKKITHQLWENSAPLRDRFHYRSIQLNELKFQFNSFAFWIDSFCAFSAATRNIIDPIIHIDLVSEDGLYRVNDKNTFDGFNTRIAFVPPALVPELNEYKIVRQKVLAFLKKQHALTDKEKEIVQSNELFFFQQDSEGNLKIVEYTRSRCRDEIYYQANNDPEIKNQHIDLSSYEYLRALKTNVNRHYLRGRLLDLGMPGYYIDALMGHWHEGTQPWGKMSTFNQQKHINSLKNHLPKILKELGFYYKDEL